MTHLVRRFFAFLSARPLSPSEQADISSVLPPNIARLFFAQRFEDQRHGVDVWRRVGLRRDLSEAALMHDVGKTESDLGPFGRSAATLWNRLGLSAHGRWKSYLDHAEVGAAQLEEVGASNLAVLFTRHHPGEPPPDVDPRMWQLLEDADNV